MINSFTPYQTDVLFLLIGSNPLPNYVAACLLTHERSTVVLLNSLATSAVAERLAKRLASERRVLTFQFCTVPEADGPAIGRKVSDVAQSFERSYPRLTIGLNYTGGTKPMAAYSYQVLAQMFPAGIFSYLDAHTLRMVIDPGGGAVQRVPVERQVTLKLDDIVDLHGYEIKQRREKPRHQPIAAAIAETHLADNGMNQWRTWLDSWKYGAKLPDLNQFPALAPAMNAFDAVCGGTATENGVAKVFGFHQLKQCGKYFVGGWLEDYTLDSLGMVNQQMRLDDYAGELLVQAPRRPELDLDVAATVGYQLFAISCMVTNKKGSAKEHLLEVVTRAGQLGGDEARFAAVTFCDDKNVKELEQEVSEAWDAAGKIKVFGRSHIRDLSSHLLRWFREANQEVS